MRRQQQATATLCLRAALASAVECTRDRRLGSCMLSHTALHSWRRSPVDWRLQSLQVMEQKVCDGEQLGTTGYVQHSRQRAAGSGSWTPDLPLMPSPCTASADCSGRGVSPCVSQYFPSGSYRKLRWQVPQQEQEQNLSCPSPAGHMSSSSQAQYVLLQVSALQQPHQ